MFGLSWQTIIGATLLLGFAFGMGALPDRNETGQIPGESLRVACAEQSPLCEPGDHNSGSR